MNDNDVPTLALTPEAALDHLAALAGQLLASHSGRVVLGLAGGPGVGKSTLAGRLVEQINASHAGLAAYVPMDGFHMRHRKLEELGTVADKGAPHTFEGEAFAQFLAAARTAREPLSGPGYSRQIEDVVQDAFIIGATARLIVGEGNYLLLNLPPWQSVRPLLDLAVFIDVPRDKVRTRLLRRHAEGGLFTEARNLQHVERVDLANYDLVQRSKTRADLVIQLVTER